MSWALGKRSRCVGSVCMHMKVCAVLAAAISTVETTVRCSKSHPQFTPQAMAFLAHLAESRGVWGPFLVISPASTLHNWDRELHTFLPEFKVGTSHPAFWEVCSLQVYSAAPAPPAPRVHTCHFGSSQCCGQCSPGTCRRRVSAFDHAHKLTHTLLTKLYRFCPTGVTSTTARSCGATLRRSGASLGARRPSTCA